ncbi:helix-turn-helix domain-containing protein [Pukyongiella litopenaei]|uniref:Helix-turn-helix domain-containing protein n=1 Tax=Pukyongiella litopenaei TaxID=2605946 RepID=A0A2S0MNX3_9RHOB|nr:XRE family transcriptional regulator [Pukyongiella litopenaei]AVO37592.1 helix-turn-helix domain-containing protein [Pukyongiella litopenaei]
MTETQDDILNRLPARLRAARQAQGLSLEAVANLSGVSRSMVSQIERGESSPTIATLWNLTRALQVDFAGLLDTGQEGDRVEVLRADEVPEIDNLGHGVRVRILSPPEDAGRHELYELVFAPGGALISQPHGRGAAEQLAVIDGTLTVASGQAEQRVGAGDVARYAADIAHSIRALDGAARAFLVVTAP